MLIMCIIWHGITVNITLLMIHDVYDIWYLILYKIWIMIDPVGSLTIAISLSSLKSSMRGHCDYCVGETFWLNSISRRKGSSYWRKKGVGWPERLGGYHAITSFLIQCMSLWLNRFTLLYSSLNWWCDLWLVILLNTMI